MEKLAAQNSKQLINILTERLVFERAGVQLYDRVLEVMRASRSEQVKRMLPAMEVHRDEEKEHEEWLEAQVRALGGDAHGTSERGALVQRESKGLEEVVMGEERVPHLFHALLVAELADNAGWDLLLQLAHEAGDHEASREFRRRLHEEEKHLLFIRRAVEKFASAQVLDREVVMPAAP